MSNARALAQEAVNWYFDHIDAAATNQDNVARHLRGPVQAVTLSILQQQAPPTSPTTASENGNDDSGSKSEEKKVGLTTWRDYLESSDTTAAQSDLPEWNQSNQVALEALGRRTMARLEAFLEGVALAVPSEEEPTDLPSSGHRAAFKQQQRFSSNNSSGERSASSFSLIEGLSGFRAMEQKRLAASQDLLRSISISSQSSRKSKHCPQIAKDELVTRLELYIRSLYRVSKSQPHLECVLAAEPIRAIKARARSVVLAFVNTVGTIRQQSPVLTRLLQCLTKELLAVEVLGENLIKVLRRIVSDYEHQTSFASLAFLSSPENSAQVLTPLVLKYLKYLQQNWKLCESECELERFLSLAIDPQVRHLFKTIEFQSIGHLLEVCQGLRNELHHIEIAPDICPKDEASNEMAIQQAIRDLRREIITVNDHILPPVSSRQELCHLLSQVLNSRTLTNAPPKKSRRRRSSKTVRRSESAPAMFTPKIEPSSSSECDADISDTSGSEQSRTTDRASNAANAEPRKHRRRGSFQLSTVDFLTRRLLLAAGRTGTGGDAYFVVRDLFGGDDVEVVPSREIPTHGRAVRPGTIEILVKLASVTIKCHGSFDVYPKLLVGDVEPLIQVHTTTTEVIALKEVRKVDSTNGNGALKDDDNYSSNDDNEASSEAHQRHAMVIEEVQTAKTGWRTLSIRPALYEKVEVWNTPS